MRSPALITISSKTGCHAVLASLSGRYPPLEGRSPTCYSPVRHSTQGLLPFRVRLACVRHAASVDSEPGSNSHVNSRGHHPLLLRRTEALRHITDGRQTVNASALLMIGSCVVSCVEYGRNHDAAPDCSGREHLQFHRLILDGLFRRRPRSSRCARSGESACTSYLVFKEPASPGARSAHPAAPFRPPFGRRQANLPRLSKSSEVVKPLYFPSRAAVAPAGG